MRRVFVFFVLLFFSVSCFADKGVLRISANMEEVDIYNGDEQIAMLGEGTTEVELKKGKYTITLRKPIDDTYEYKATKKIFVGADSMTRISFKLEKGLTKQGLIAQKRRIAELQARKKKRIAELQARDEKLLESGEGIKYKGLLYGIVKSPYTGKLWLDRNLGASRVCASSKDEKCYGDYYQWGRTSDGHEKKSSSITSSISSSAYPNHSKFIKSSKSNRYDWIKSKNDKLWQSESGKSNPCPKGFRVPTISELKAETLNQGVKNSNTAYKNFLKFPLAGYRYYSDGSLGHQGSYGDVWSSSVEGKYSWYLYFDSDDADVGDYYRAYGFSVRCLKD